MKQVLIIDDEPGIRMALKRWFERRGYAVLEAGDGLAASVILESASTDGPDALVVIICDLHLPGLGGDALLERFATERPVIASRIILSTGDAIDDLDPETVIGRHPFLLQKPFDLSTLKLVVDRVLGEA